jgi:hypothetical protein
VITRNIARTASAVLLAGALLTGCASGGPAAGPATSPPASAPPSPRPSSPARLTILSPSNGEVVHGATVHVRLALKGARIVHATTTHISPTTGHVHVYLDGKIVSMNYSLDNTIPNVTPGQHVLRVEFVASDHLPFDPRVIEGVAFVVKA